MLLLILLGAILYLPQEPQPHASITGHLAEKKVQQVYLTLGPLREWQGIRVDSTVCDSTGFFRFEFTPDPKAEYGIAVAEGLVSEDIGLVPGDSIELMQPNNETFATLVYDRLGANNTLQDIDGYYGMYKFGILTMDFEEFDDSVKSYANLMQQIVDTAVQLRAHPSLYESVETRLNGYRLMALSSYLYYNNDSINRFDSAQGYTRIVDSLLSLTGSNQLTAIPDFDLAFVVYQLKFNRWKHEQHQEHHHDSASSAYLSNFFTIAKSVKPPFRDYALYLAVQNVAWLAPHFPAAADFDMVHFLDSESALTTPLFYDQRFLQLLRIKIANIEAVTPGNKAPSFVLEDTSGINHDFSEFRGNVIVLHFWGIWCSPCIESLPMMATVENAYHDRPVVFVDIAIEGENGDGWRKMLRRSGLHGVQLLAMHQFQSAVAKSYRLSAVPTYVVIDKKGRITYRAEGTPSDTELNEAIDKQLN